MAWCNLFYLACMREQESAKRSYWIAQIGEHCHVLFNICLIGKDKYEECIIPGVT